MRALTFHEFGPPGVLRVADVAKPVPTASQVLIRVSHAAIHFADTERRRGLYLREIPFPVTLGSECSGVVEAVGSPAHDALLGQRVTTMTRLSQAEWCVAEADDVVVLPPALSSQVAAACFLRAITAWHVLFTAGREPAVTASVPSLAGKNVGVTAAAGGVGLLLIQLAKLAGADVVAVASTQEKCAVALTHGAAHAFPVTTELKDQVFRATAGHGLDVWCDSVGAPLQHLVPELLAPLGRWVAFGDAGGPLLPIAPGPLFVKSATFTNWWLKTPLPPRVKRAAFDGVLQLLAEAKLSLPVEVLPLDQAAGAHARLESRQVTGALVFALT